MDSGPIKDLSRESEALTSVCVAIQKYYSEGLSVSALEQTGWALQVFRREVAMGVYPIQPSTLLAGTLLCSLHVSRPR